METLEVFLALILIFGGLAKLTHSGELVVALTDLRPMRVSLAYFVSLLLVFTELALGTGLIIGRETRVFAAVASILLGLYLVVVVTALRRQSMWHCSCFGPLDTGNVSIVQVLRNAILLTCSVLIAMMPNHWLQSHVSEAYMPILNPDAVVGGAGLAIIMMSWSALLQRLLLFHNKLESTRAKYLGQTN